MKTIFNQQESEGLVERIDILSKENSAQWGKMNAYQMIKHCIESENMYLGNVKLKRLFIGKLFGKMALKGMVNDDRPLGHGKPTHPTFKITGNGKVEELKEEWIELIKQYNVRSEDNFRDFEHPFFGKMTKQQLGVSVFKHIDHHLRQFGV